MLVALHRYVLYHDESKVFVFGYVAAAVVLALWLGLFWLAVVVMVHLLFEIVKQHSYDRRPLPILTRSLWELKLDIGLVLFGIVIGLYMGVIIGAAGLGAAGRVGVQAATRVGIWQRALRGLLLTLDDVAIVVKARSARQNDGRSAAEPARAPALVAAEVDGRNSVSAQAADPAATDAGPGSPDRTDPAPDPAPQDPAHQPPHPPPEPPAGGAALWGDWVAPRWSRGDRFSIGFTVLSLLLIMATPLITDHTMASTWAVILHEMRPFP